MYPCYREIIDESWRYYRDVLTMYPCHRETIDESWRYYWDVLTVYPCYREIIDESWRYYWDVLTVYPCYRETIDESWRYYWDVLTVYPCYREIIDESWRYYRELLNSAHARAAGVRELSGYYFTRHGPRQASIPHLERLCVDYRAVTERELNICPGGWTDGVFCTTLLADDTYHLDWLTQR